MMGRQRSGVQGAHHHRQSSENFLATSSNGRWLQSAGLQQFQSSDNAIPPIQGYGYHNMGGDQGSRSYRSVQPQTSYKGSVDLFALPLTPTGNSSCKNGEERGSQSDNSSGLLDLQAFDSELLTEMPMPGIPVVNYHSRGRSFDDSDPYFGNNKQSERASLLPDNNVMRSLAADNAKASSNVAKIKVVVRKRPLNKKELAKNEEDIIETHSNSLVVHETKLKVDLTEYVEKHEFCFDAVLNEEVSNNEVYRETVEAIVPIIFQRTKATCFAYGQTGSGKTYTMKPLPLKAVRDILRLMHYTYRNQGFQLFVSFFEIYGGKLFDLLSDRKKLFMREDGKQQVCIVGLQEYRVSDVETVKELIEKGNACRSTGTTGANEESSRSHAILQLSIKRSADGSESKPPKVVGKLSFIDLAGSERGADTTDNDKQTRMEGAEINKSLLALKECIRALDNDQGHIPFRGSKLTEVLRDSFVGNSRTVMVSCISPNAGSCEHTLNTLRYADRVKSLSKGNNSKRDTSFSTSNLKESTPPPPPPTFEDDDSVEPQPEEYEDEFYEPEKWTWKKTMKVGSYSNVDEGAKRANSHAKLVGAPKLEMKHSNPDNNLAALLKEEEDFVNCHRKQVEETIEIVREEMDLLVDADQPGNQLDEYISKLNSILSKKAAACLGIPYENEVRRDCSMQLEIRL
ncbi:kinesin-like protein KIN-13B isoform X2 [Andrographis paniculata]|uniref:kinesin-like protein KIN-13B isoform X2 n=1 Tax=Andrographis paniculata TaxID=175694 RepID=UPI0021E7671A|nr:kinesin-like protein KIN-13B isoform X2 [Andrographis paniculata]